MKFPCKVLLAGGYGVLQHANCGLVLALSSYFYAFYAVAESHSAVVRVISPQIDSVWTYKVDGAVEQVGGDSDNRFVRCSVE